MGPSRRVVICIAIAGGACSAGDNSVDPSDLGLRDLLGISPDVATAWNAAQRAAARHVLAAGLRETDAPSQIALAPGAAIVDEHVARLLATGDATRAAGGAEPLGMVRVAVGTREAACAPRIATTTAAALADTLRVRAVIPPVELWLAERWDTERVWGRLPGRGLDVLAALAGDAGHSGGAVIVVPAPRLAVIAAYVEPSGDAAQPRILVNPVLLAAIEPDPDELATAAALDRWSNPPDPTTGHRETRPPIADQATVESTGGNPYSFYGSVAECASALRTRCETCLAGSACTPITSASDGNTECTMLGADAGRGYFLLCINLSLAITSVDRCTDEAAPTCVRDPDAADSLATLENNAAFLADPACAGALDACLARIYGAPDAPFPGPDGGTAPPGPARSTTVSCGDGCDNNNTSCNASPSSDCSGASCNNSLSCDSACSSSNDQSGCGGNCDACSSSGGGGGGGGDGCSSSSDSSSDGCGSSDGGGDSCGSCGSSSDSSSCGSGDSCGSCGSSSSDSSSCGSCGGSGGSSSGCSSGGGGKCSVASAAPGPGVAVAASMFWGVLPVPFALRARRRARRRRLVHGAGVPTAPARDGQGRVGTGGSWENPLSIAATATDTNIDTGSAPDTDTGSAPDTGPAHATRDPREQAP